MPAKQSRNVTGARVKRVVLFDGSYAYNVILRDGSRDVAVIAAYSKRSAHCLRAHINNVAVWIEAADKE